MMSELLIIILSFAEIMRFVWLT